ncbi:hypothetical protein C8Q80DRAFT_1271995 [Daedaleopsis nitida]|nr:hypothetical protein C8Q80DRAFT_1271995 [Daedaleopsis nitida]
MEEVDPRPSVSVSQKVPAEIWLEIFELVPKSSDLHSVSVACRKFHQLSFRAMHRDLVWTNAKRVANNLAMWNEPDNAGMAALVRSLVLGVTRLPRTPGFSYRAVDVDGTIVHEDNLPHGDMTNRLLTSRIGLHEPGRSYMSAALSDAMWTRVTAFAVLSSLVLANLYVVEDHFKLIHSLPQLRSLHIDSCVFHADASRGYNHTVLPITELTMLNVRRGGGMDIEIPVHHIPHHVPPAGIPLAGNFNHVQQVIAAGQFNWHAAQLPILHPPDPISQVLSLAIAHKLKKITVDGSADVFRYIYEAPGSVQRGWLIPTTLEHIFVVRKRTCVGAPPKPTPNADNTFPDTFLHNACMRAPNLKTISTPIFVPTSVAVAPEAVPFGLERFAGPLETAHLIATGRDVKALGMFKCAVSAREGISALTHIAMRRPGLKMLMMECRGWDGEILSAVAGSFRALRRLKIVYEGNGPEESDVVAMAPDHLAQLPELHTLELFKLPSSGGFTPSYPRSLFDSSFPSLEAELQDLLIPWKKHCPSLRKVQLMAGYVMTRAYEDAPWKLSRVARIDDVEDLEY